MPTDKSKIVTLYRPENKNWEAMQNEFNWRYNKDIIQEYAKMFKKSLEGYSIIEKEYDGSDCTSSFADDFIKSKDSQKATLAKFVAFFMADSRNLTHYCSMIPEHIKYLNNRLLQQGYVSIAELEREHPDVVWATKSRYSWRESDLSSAIKAPWLQMESVNEYKWGWNDDDIPAANTRHYYALGGTYLNHFLPALFTDCPLVPEGMEELPSSETLTVFNAEEQMSIAFPIIQSLILQGSLECGNTLKVKQTDLRKVYTLTGIKHFHPEDLPKDQALANAFSLSLPLICNICHLYKKHAKGTYQNIVREIVSLIGGWFTPTTLLKYFLPYLTGLNKRYNDTSPKYQIIPRLFTAIRATNGKWIDFEQIHRNITVHKLGFSIYDTTISIYEFNETSIDNKMHEFTLLPEHFVDQISIPLLKSIVCALAGLGLMEIAYRPYNSKDGELTPFDFIRYARLTKLGEYAFGISKTYEAPKTEDIKYFEIDEEHLIIRSLQDNNPYEQLLQHTAAPIGNHRYRMSPESFLNHCSSKDDVEKNVEQFRNFVCAKPPKIWEDFFAEIKNRVSPLTSDSPHNYHIFSISPANKGLIQLLTTDSELRSLIIRAEGCRILVTNSNMTKFKNRLKAFGYLL